MIMSTGIFILIFLMVKNSCFYKGINETNSCLNLTFNIPFLSHYVQ